MTSHRAWQESLAARSLLTAAEETRLAEHLQHCAECRALADDYARQDTFLCSLPVPHPSPAMRRAVLEAVAARPERQRFRVHRLWPALVPLAALLVVVLVLFHPSGANHPSARPALPDINHRPPLARATSFGADAIPASPLIPFGAGRASGALTVTHGIRISVSTARPRYPRNALVPVQVVLRNVGHDLVSVEGDQSFSCTDFRPRLAVLDDRGREVNPLPLVSRPIPSCPLIPPNAGNLLRPGRSEVVTLYAVLMARHIQAVMVLHRYYRCRPKFQTCRPNSSVVRGPLLTLGMTPSDLPRVVLRGAPPHALQLGRTPYSHGRLWADGWYTCANSSGQTYEEGGIGPGSGKGSSNFLRLPTGNCASRHTTLHLVAGWPNHSVVFVNYGKR